MKLGIIPAGGKAIRWEGYPKELLAIGSAWTLLDRHILLQTRALADHVVIASSEEKKVLHEWWIEHRGWPDVSVEVAPSVMDSIKVAIAAGNEATNRYLFSMPDTYTDLPLFPESIDKPLVLGIFNAEHSDRYGMLRNGAILDKQEGLPGKAWGAFMFKEEVAQYWMENEFQDHTHMLNVAMENFEWETWDIDLYFDVESFQTYLNLLGGLHNAKKQSAVQSPSG